MRFLSLLLLLLCVSVPVQAQFGRTIPDEVVTWTASVRPPSTAQAMTDTFAPGERAYVTLTGQVADGWRVYAVRSPAGFPARLSLDELPEGLSRYGDPGEAAPRTGHDAALGEDYRYHAGEVRVWQGLQIDEQATGGPVVVSGTLRYAACNDEVCLPPRDFPFQVRFAVRSAG
jgi:hypothetical protein